MDKCGLNKIKLLPAFFLITSCIYLEPNRIHNNTEMLCPNIGLKILIRHSYAAEVRKALERFYNHKKATDSRTKYTVIVLGNRHDIYFNNVPIEDFMSCAIRDVVWDHVSKEYIVF